MPNVTPADPDASSPALRPVQLPEGIAVWTRPIEPGDAAAIQRLYGRLSPETIYPRFFMVSPQLSSERAIYFTAMDGTNRRALAALDPQAPDEIIGVARYHRAPEADRAEFAMALEDRWQGRGLGSRLLGLLIADARARGIRYFDGYILPENRRMFRVLQRLGLPWRVRAGGSPLHVEVDLGARPDAAPTGAP